MNPPQLKGTTNDPTIQINGAYYNVTWFQITNKTASDTIEGNLTGPPENNLNISWNDNLNSSVAMPFSTSNVTTYFNGVQLWIGYNNTSPPDFRVELRNGTLIGSMWVPSNASDAILLSQTYSNSSFNASGNWVTLLNETTIKLNPSQTYFILVRLNTSTSSDNTTYYTWGCTPNSGGLALNLKNFTDIEQINDTNLWSQSSVAFNCWMIMNLTKLQYTLTLQLPANWTLNQLSVDVFNNTGNINYNIAGSTTGNITGGTGSFNVIIPNGDRMYLAVINFTSITPVSQLHVIENVTNSDGFAHTVGNVSQAQRFTLPDDSNNLTIQILILRTTGLTQNLTAEIWNATFDSSIGAYNLSSNVTGVALEVPYQNVNSTYNLLTLNFTGHFSQGNYFLVIHTKNWTGDPSSGQFYDWASHTSAFEIPPPEGYGIWTTPDNSSNWNWKDVRDPFGHRYWQCMQITSYNSTDTSGINISVNNKLVGGNRVWNDTVWTPIQNASGSIVTFNLASSKDIQYSLTYNLFYYNYSDGLSNHTLFYINDISMVNSTQGYWSQIFTSSQVGYNSSTGVATLIFKAWNQTSQDWNSTSLNASINAQMVYTNTSTFSGSTFTSIYTHSNATISLSQESEYVSYNPAANQSAANTIFLNSTLLSDNWTEAFTNSITKTITILKNAFNSTSIGQELSNGETMNTTITFYSQVNVTSTIVPYKGTSVTLNITNVLDNPSNLTVTIINPNGTMFNYSGNTTDFQNWNVNFTPQDIGEYIASVTTNSSNNIMIRGIGNQALAQNYYIFNVYQLEAGLIEPDVTLNETLTLGIPFNLQIWVRYLPFNASSTPQVNLTNLTVFLNGESHDATVFYNNNTGIAELPITPSSLGNLNITLNVTDNAGRSFNESFTVQVVTPTPPSPIPILSLLTANAASGQFDMDTLSRIVTIIFGLLVVVLILMRVFYPDTLTRIHETLLRRQ